MMEMNGDDSTISLQYTQAWYHNISYDIRTYILPAVLIPCIKDDVYSLC